MKYILLFVMWFFTAAQADDLVLKVGSSKEIKGINGGQVFNSNSTVLKVRPTNTGLLLIGKKVGEADVRVGKKNYSIVVATPQTELSYNLLSDLVAQMQGLKVTWQNGQVLITGELLRLSDWFKLAKLAESRDLTYTFQARIEKEFSVALTQHLENRMRQLRLSKGALSETPLVRLVLSPDQKLDLDLYKSVVTPFGIPIVISRNSLELEPLIGIKILVTEIRKAQFQRLGLQWPASYQAQLIPEQKIAPGELSLEAIEANGVGKILASPHLICRSGKEASFLAGGEIPIKVINFKTSQVIWKKYGVLLNVKPRADQSGHMSIQLETEVSTLDTSQSIDGVPGLLTNRISTHFDLEKSQTIALSGMIKNESGNAKEGLPFLSRIPILGLLFSSQEYRDQKTELVILVTPHVIDPANINSTAKGLFE